MTSELFQSSLVLFLLLNPFLVIVYLKDIVAKTDSAPFRRILLRAGMITIVVCIIFGLVGEVIFSSVLQAQYASLQIFGGIVFLIIGLRFVFGGSDAILDLRGDPAQITGAIVMPIMIGPGSISASIVAGKRLSTLGLVGAVTLAVVASVGVLILLKQAYDYVHPRNERLVLRYTEVAGRVAALVVGTFSIEMIMQGAATWWSKLS